MTCTRVETPPLWVSRHFSSKWDSRAKAFPLHSYEGMQEELIGGKCGLLVMQPPASNHCSPRGGPRFDQRGRLSDRLLSLAQRRARLCLCLYAF